MRVQGEVSGAKLHGSGHFYFTLKDDSASLSCTMWRTQVARLPQLPRDGDLVVAGGRLTVYEPRGSYQLSVNVLKPAGAGDLAARLEALKAKLSAEGLFDPARKRDLPPYPFRVAVVTSPTGAVLHDIWNVLSRRAPHLSLLLAPSPVQGAECASGVVRALASLAGLEGTPEAPDVVIVARGGGSLEDLWGFNEEAVVRAVAACPFPVVSAVGHETDVTLCDFAADLRAPTPSAAAELVSLERDVLLAELEDLLGRCGQGLLSWVDRRRERLEQLASRPCLRRPEASIERAAQGLDLLSDRLDRCVARALERGSDRLAGRAGRLDALSPLRVLARGFAAIEDERGRVVTRRADLAPGQDIRVRLRDGAVAARVGEAVG